MFYRFRATGPAGFWSIVVCAGLVGVVGAVGAVCMVDAEASPASIARDGQAELDVVIAQDAGPTVEKAAEDLARKLEAITGGAFDVVRGDGAEGLAVGTREDFPALELAEAFDVESIAGREQYVLRSHEGGIYLIGASELAAQHAVWDLLHAIGYRQLKPTPGWQIVPDKPELRVEVDVRTAPDYFNRMAPRPAPWSDAELWQQWHDRNRMSSAFELDTSHAYNGIIRRNQQAFDENPRMLALVDGERGGGRGDKFCIASRQLRELVVEDAIARVDAQTQSISMDPSDGGDWCACQDCAELGSVSDRVVLLANAVAEAVNELGHGPVYVGMYAYNQHSPPPTVDAHPKVIVSIATAFIRGGYTVDELIDGWSQRTEMLGIRGYHDVHPWNLDAPLSARGGDVDRLAERMRHFHGRGARFMNSESSDSWGANGLGYYISSRLLWDTRQAEDIDAIVDDFVSSAFAQSHEPMHAFYTLIVRDRDTIRPTRDLHARMYRHLNEARELADDPAERGRIDELILYTRYVELLEAYRAAEGAQRQEAAQELYHHAYRMRDMMLVHVPALYRHLRDRDSAVTIPDEAGITRLSVGAPGTTHEPWTRDEPFAADQIERILQRGMEANPPLQRDFEPVTYSRALVPAAEALDLPNVQRGSMGRDHRFRGEHAFYTWVEPDRPLALDVTGGLIAHYRDRGNVRFKLHALDDNGPRLVDSDRSVPPDGEQRAIDLHTDRAGLHRLQWDDGDDRTQVSWPADQPMTAYIGQDGPAALPDNRTLYFYVPRGTELVGGLHVGSMRGSVRDGDGNEQLDLADMDEPGYFQIPVPEGQDGTLWQLRRAYGKQLLLTVPPYVAPSGDELLLPAELVERDGR